MGQSKDYITGFWVVPDNEVLEDFFLAKSIQEQKLGRLLTDKEVHELLASFKAKGEIDGFEVEGDVRKLGSKILAENFNTIDPSKREDNENV